MTKTLKGYPVRIAPQIGEIYTNRNGDEYLCTNICNESVSMERLKDGWTLKAHGVRQYPDGTIEWDYSTGGHWAR
ncbi:hypothetical protein [Anaeromassilibacillus senegalensis]|uniref:hypothetical protein n=1 Tax=Anaeromassilibacillus senegalensis TaxID=1673717 RepID=UPI000682426B|nr:hypothetical protein [Anaeromassilibacillus senegalensis]